MQQRSRQHRARVPGRDDRIRLSVGDGTNRANEGRVGLRTYGVDRMVVHVDRVGRLDQPDSAGLEAGRAEQHWLDAVSRGVGRAEDDLPGGAVATEGVDGHASHAWRLRRVDAERLDVPALVRLAVGADAMHSLRLLAGRADLDVRRRQRVLCAALVAPRPRCLSLRNGHERLGTIAGGPALSSARSARESAGRARRRRAFPRSRRARFRVARQLRDRDGSSARRGSTG